MRVLHYDTETRSILDLTKVGSYLYARHSTTDLRCVSYCLVTDGVRGPLATWQPGDPPPPVFTEVAQDPEALTCVFNDAFDRQIHEQILAPRYGWPVIPLARRRCAQAAALARALPGSLDNAAAALRITTRKTAAGVAMMKRLARPRGPVKKRKDAVPDFNITAEELTTLIDYNRTDVVISMDVVDRIGLLPPSEQTIWELDQLINERGVEIDLDLLETALSLSGEAKLEAQAQIAELTGNVVTTAGQVPRIRKWLEQHGCKLSNLRKETVADTLVEPDLDPSARRLLELRQSSGGAATSKFTALRRWLDPQQADRRVRYAYRYHGASSGRFSSLGVQLHNLKKPEIDDVARAIAAVASGSLTEMRRRGYERPLETLGQITRALIIAAPGHRLFIADLSGIEARGAAYVCGAEAELEQWRKFDRTGQVEDEPYYLTGRTTFGQPAATARKAGKTGSLAFQYQGGVGAYRKAAKDYSLPEETIVARRDAWRADHPLYTQFWRLAVFQAVQAIRHPGEECSAKVVSFRYDLRTGFLELTLPSGRTLSYPAAELFEDERYDTTSFTFLDASGSKTGRMYHERRGSGAFGGLIFENIIQALCRDVFVEAMPRLEAAGYPITMHTHDEYVCEVPDGYGSLEEFNELVTRPPSWAPELPIAAKVRISDRLIEIVEPARATPIVVDNIITNTLIRDEEESDDERDLEDVEIEPVELPASLMTDPPFAPEYAHAFASGPVEREAPSPPPPPPEPPPPPPPGPGNGQSSHAEIDPNDFLRADSEPAASPGSGNGAGAYPHGEDPAPGPGAAATEYIYRDARGRLHMRVVRVVQAGKKNFPTYHWDAGGWTLGWPDEIVPYRLPELLAAPADTIVLVCEGEKDADTTARFGFVSTTNPGGAGKWQPELTQYFRGKQRVCILEDNDASGAKHTATVLRALKGVVPTIGVVRFPELGPGKDVSDYFARGGSKDYLAVRIEEALRQGVACEYTLLNLKDVPSEAQDWLWEGHLQIGTLELVTGIPGVGKSLLQCNLIATITTGRDWPNGMPGPKPGQVIILTAEDRAVDYKRRLLAAKADLDRTNMLTSIKRNARDELFLLSEDLEKLEQAIHDLGDVSLVAFDPITAFMGHGKGFDSHRVTDVRSQLHPLSRLAEKVNVAFSAVTHPPKNAGTRSAIDSFIGSTAFIGAARVGHYCIAELGPEDDRGRRRPTGRVLFTNPKFSHSRPMPTLAYRIEAVCVGFDAKREQDIIAPRIVWDSEPVDITPDEAIAANKPSTGDGRKARAAPAREFLRELLADGPVLAKVAIERGAARGFSIDQFKRARAAIAAVVFKRKGESLSSPWLWALSKDVPGDAVVEGEKGEDEA